MVVKHPRAWRAAMLLGIAIKKKHISVTLPINEFIECFPKLNYDGHQR